MLFVRSTFSNIIRRSVQASNSHTRTLGTTTAAQSSVSTNFITATTKRYPNKCITTYFSSSKNKISSPVFALAETASSCLRYHSSKPVTEIITRETMSTKTIDKTVQLTQEHINFGKKACTFLSKATDPYYAVATSIARLKDAGFVEISTISPSTIVPGGKYYYVVHHTTFVAFTVGSQYVPDGSCGFHIIGGHTDSPNLSIKPKSKKPSKAPGVTQLAVQCYGGGLWHTWFDRDLSFSGQVYIRQKLVNGDDDRIVSKLVQCTDPIARVSTLCIHLQSASERDVFAVNKEEHTSPIIAATNIRTGQQIETAITDQITGTTVTTEPPSSSVSDEIWTSGQEPSLLQRIATELGLDTEQEEIIDFHLNLYDTQIPTVGGMNNEFIYSARLDNLATVFCATEALAEHDPTEDRDISLIACFDHEEVGSVSLNGAGSPIIEQAIRRISSALLSTSSSNTAAQYDELYATTIANSFCLSIDQAHAIHPNYASKHDPQHAPVMNGGIVIKNNANQRYATSRYSALLIREISRIAAVPIQEFAVKNDCPCGSTIGPTISALTGIRTVDAGMPQLSMHSCREVMGTIDLSYGYQLFRAYFQHFRTIDSKMNTTTSI